MTSINFSKMNSKSLLSLISTGKLNKTDAKKVAEIMERRFPTPIQKTKAVV